MTSVESHFPDHMTVEEFRARGLEATRIGIRNAKRAAGIPVDDSPKRKREYISTEKDTQKACLELLAAKRIFYYRQNSGVIKYPDGRFIRYGTPGCGDIVMVIDGHHVELEIKDIHGEQSESQVAYQEKLERAGGTYLVIRSIDELKTFLETI